VASTECPAALLCPVHEGGKIEENRACEWSVWSLKMTAQRVKVFWVILMNLVKLVIESFCCQRNNAPRMCLVARLGILYQTFLPESLIVSINC